MCPERGAYHFNPKPIKTILCLLLALLFALVVRHYANGQVVRNYRTTESPYVSSTSIDHQKPRRPLIKASNSLAMRSYGGNEDNIALGQQIALSQGIYGDEWECLYNLGKIESNWSETATNKTSGAFGIAQSLPASKYDTIGNRYDPEVQIKWMIQYISDKYSTPCHAYQLQISRSPHWY